MASRNRLRENKSELSSYFLKKKRSVSNFLHNSKITSSVPCKPRGYSRCDDAGGVEGAGGKWMEVSQADLNCNPLIIEKCFELPLTRTRSITKAVAAIRASAIKRP